MTAFPATPAEVPRIDAAGVTLSVAVYGVDGPPLLLLHGIGSRGVSWFPVLDRLAAAHRLIVPDLRGHGASEKPERGCQVSDYTADVIAIVAALGLERLRVVGHSLGGRVAVEVAARRPELIDRLILEDMPLSGHPHAVGMFDTWIALASMTVAEAAAHYRSTQPDWSDADCLRRAESITGTDLGVFREARQRASRGWNIWESVDLARIAAPTLLLYGDLAAGGQVGRADAERFAAALPNGRAVQIPDGSHSLHRDQTTAFLAAVTEFLD